MRHATSPRDPWRPASPSSSADGVNQTLLGERLHEEGIGPSFARARLHGENAEDQYDGVAQRGIQLDGSTECQAVHLGHEDLGDDDVRSKLPRALQRGRSVRGELNRESRLVEEVGLELADVRIAFDDENDGPSAGFAGADVSGSDLSAAVGGSSRMKLTLR